MRSKGKFILINLALIALLSLISCIASSIPTGPTLVLPTSTLSFSTAPPVIYATATYTLTPTSIPSTFIFPSPTQIPILSGKVLSEGDAIKNGVKSHGLIVFNTKTDEATLVFEERQEINGQLVTLDYPSITWSPDGHWFAFVGTDARTNKLLPPQQDIYVAKADGTDIHRLTETPQYQKFDISWSPDKKHILVAMGINGSSLFLIDSNSGEVVRRLTTDASSYSAAWSPTGEKIAFQRYSGLAVMNVNDETSQALDIPYNLHVEDISWSPNNHQIVFSAYSDSSCTDVFMINVNTGGFMNLTFSNNYENSPVWLPDGGKLAFSRSDYTCKVEGASWDIYTTNLIHEESKAVSNVGYRTSVAWAPVPNLEIGKQYMITALGAFLNLRTEPSRNGQTIIKLPAGEIVSVIEGFVDADDYYWWKIRTQDGAEGWAVEMANWYTPLNQ